MTRPDLEAIAARWTGNAIETDVGDDIRTLLAYIAEVELALCASEASVASQAAHIADLEHSLELAEQGHANAH